jgi:hypothetical protein
MKRKKKLKENRAKSLEAPSIVINTDKVALNPLKEELFVFADVKAKEG